MAMSLTVTPVTQGVGGASIFHITGGPPGGTIAWSSTKNGVPTGEDHSMYAGQMTDAAGNWQGSGGNWPSSMIGEWTKTAFVYPPDGSNPWTAEASFSVTAGQPSGGGGGGVYVPPPSSGGGLLDGSFNIGGANIPKIAVYGAAAVAVIFLMPGGKR